jgi:hypothetical protein
MEFSSWKQEDGYVESIVKLFPGNNSTPVLKARAVLNSDGKYEAIIRDFQSGVMVSSDSKGMSLFICKKRAIELSKKIIKYQLL